MAKKSFCTIALEFCRWVGPKYKCSKIPSHSNSKDMRARRDIQEVQPQLPLLCRRISSILTVSRVSCWSAPNTEIHRSLSFYNQVLLPEPSSEMFRRDVPKLCIKWKVAVLSVTLQFQKFVQASKGSIVASRTQLHLILKTTFLKWQPPFSYHLLSS